MAKAPATESQGPQDSGGPGVAPRDNRAKAPATESQGPQDRGGPGVAPRDNRAKAPATESQGPQDRGGPGVAPRDNRVGRHEWEGRLTEAPDLIEPPAAREPAEVLLLACAALTDGDLEAAVALYEPDATLSWGQDHTAAGHAAIRQVLAGVMDMRLPLRARAVRILRAGSLALITGERTLTGTGLDGVAVTLTGPTALIARCQPDGTWLTAADQWEPYSSPGAGRRLP